jgi:hypothetical protein
MHTFSPGAPISLENSLAAPCAGAAFSLHPLVRIDALRPCFSRVCPSYVNLGPVQPDKG